MSDLGDKIKVSRIKAGLSQEALAKKLKVSRVTITRYENGTREPDIKMLNELAAAIGVNLTKLLENTEYINITQSTEEVREMLLYVLALDEGYKSLVELFESEGYEIVEHKKDLNISIIKAGELIDTLDMRTFIKNGKKILLNQEYKDISDYNPSTYVEEDIALEHFKAIVQYVSGHDSLPSELYDGMFDEICKTIKYELFKIEKKL